MFFSNTPEKRKKDLSQWAKKYKVEALSDYSSIDQVSRLDLSFRQIDKLPKQIDALQNLEILNLSYNKLAELPWEFRNLKKLKNLNLSFNRFAEIPGVVCQLENLETLKVEANQLKKVNSGIGNLKKLKDLNLFANQILELPGEIGSLSHLSRLNLAINQLSSLPASFAKLYNVITLELWLNKFDLIPEVISKLPNLKDLYNVVDPERLNKTLIWAVIGDNTYLADKLIFNGADVNYQQEDCSNHLFTTPLFEAKSFDMITLLLAMGADPDLKREIVKHVHTKDGEEVRSTGKFESFFTKDHPKEVQKFIKAFIASKATIEKQK